MTVDVVVVDKHGNPVRDLTAADFTIAEEGRCPQTVQFFPTGGDNGKATPRRAVADFGRHYGYSTNVGAQARPERSFVIYFDDVHLTHEQGERGKTAIGRFLEQETEAGDLVSLVARQGSALARAPARRPRELVKVLATLHGSLPLEIAQERISDYEAYRIHVMQDEQMAERVARRFSTYHVFGREQGTPEHDEDRGPKGRGEPPRFNRTAQCKSAPPKRTPALPHATAPPSAGAYTSIIESMASVRGRKSVIL